MNELWMNTFDSELRSVYMDVMKHFGEMDPTTYTPATENIFRAFNLIEPGNVKVVIVGQDPYPKKYGIHVADGLAFSSTEIQPSLRNIEKCLLKSQLISSPFTCGSLDKWAMQGVLLMNKWLTYSGKIGDDYWTPLTACLLNRICNTDKDLYICMWGAKARELMEYIPDNPNVHMLTWCHPSPLNNKLPEEKRFENCNHFKIINKIYPINWQI